MRELHSLLRRQLRRVLGPGAELPPEWRPLVDAVDAAYHQFDVDRAMLERSLDLSSQELLQANADLRGMFRGFPDLFFRVAPDGTVLDLRGHSPQELHWGPEQLIGKRIRDVLVTGLGDRLERIIASARATGSIASLEFPFPRGDQQAHFEARVVPMERDEIAVLVRDITERKRSELERQESLALFRSLIDTMDAGVLIERADRIVFAANSTYCRIFGIDDGPHEMVGADSAAAVELSKGLLPDPEAFVSRIDRLIRGFEPVAGEEITFADSRVFERDYIPIHSPDGQFVGHMWQYREVTERRSLQLQLHQAQKMEAVGRLAGGVAHDFNNLLTSILGYSGLVLEGLADSELRAHVEEVRKAGERAAALTRQLLAFSRKQVLQTRVISLNDVVEGVRRMLERLIGEDIRVTTHLDPSLGLIRADAGQLEQVLLNLAVNSRDAMPSGGELVLGTREITFDDADPHERKLMAPGAYAMLLVTDNGCGMDRETQRRAFEPFFTTKEKGKGTGLGLSTVYGIVKQSGGYVWVTSEPGRGTAVKIYLPLVDEPAEPVISRPDLAVVRGSGAILVLEDERAVRALARAVLTQCGYEVLEAASGAECLRLAESYPGRIDLLLSDIVLPDLGGATVADMLRSIRPGLKVLYMSGYTDSAPAGLGKEGGGAFLQKPFAPRTLVAKVQELLGH
jgi:signal transduction histidine kinase/CheY-like chemotaxis protein